MLWVPKAGNTRKEYEDAFYPPEAGRRPASEARFSIADGATEGIYSKWWARILTASFGENVAGGFQESLSRAHTRWNRRLEGHLARRRLKGREVHWYEEQAIEAGTYSSLLQLTLRPGPSSEGGLKGTWSAVAVGDSCLFQTRGQELITCFPLRCSSSFNDRPFLICSNPARNRGIEMAMAAAGGEWRGEDTFFLMTDALARWFLTEFESSRDPWRTLDEVAMNGRDGQFTRWVAGLRQQKIMKNDDVTMMRIDSLTEAGHGMAYDHRL